MKRSDLVIHSRVIERAIERAKAVPEPNPVVIAALEVIKQEYDTIHEIVVLEPEHGNA